MSEAYEALHRQRRHITHRTSPRGTQRQPKPPANHYPHVYAFVADWLVAVYAHETGDQVRGFKWCPEWFRHAGALTRLEATWKAWENLRNDPGTGSSVWFRDHGDPCMAALTTPDTGVFARCGDGHTPAVSLPIIEPQNWLLDPTTASS